MCRDFFPVRRSAAVVRDALHTRQWESHTHRRDSCGDDLIWSTRERRADRGVIELAFFSSKLPKDIYGFQIYVNWRYG